MSLHWSIVTIIRDFLLNLSILQFLVYLARFKKGRCSRKWFSQNGFLVVIWRDPSPSLSFLPLFWALGRQKALDPFPFLFNKIHLLINVIEKKMQHVTRYIYSFISKLKADIGVQICGIKAASSIQACDTIYIVR